MLTETQSRIKVRIVRALHTRLLEWYRQNRRVLPWRGTADPYAVLVSEIMLQQTRATAVIPYYDRWMRVFPTLESLANATLSKVLRAWAGLGYYARARHLRRAAQIIVRRYNGKIPRNLAELQTLPGIGRYTAGAVASIAFSQAAPVLDGNVIRVLSRLFLIEQDTSTTQIRKLLWSLAEEILPKSHPGDFNQALMELGATVCLADTPKCSLCPLRKVCQARRYDQASRLPVVRKRKPTRHMMEYAIILMQNNRVWLNRRKQGELMAGLWVFPRLQSVRQIEAQFPGLLTKHIGRVEHTVMNRRITVEAIVVDGCKGTLNEGRWVSRRNLLSMPLPAADRRLATLSTST